jgi:MFS superfamily sulfate permease-like transporter
VLHRQLVAYLLHGLKGTQPATLVMGIATVSFLIGMKRLQRWRPSRATSLLATSSTLIAVVLATSAAAALAQGGVLMPIVGPVPGGLPNMALPMRVNSVPQVRYSSYQSEATSIWSGEP